MYQVFKDFAAPVATIVAALSAVVVTAYFAARQAWIAEEKLRHDLFDRRLQIFTSIFDFYNAMISWEGTQEQIVVRERFFQSISRSMFSIQAGIRN
jgi:hypothetical protein